MGTWLRIGRRMWAGRRTGKKRRSENMVSIGFITKAEDEPKTLDVLGGGIDVELEEGLDITARCIDLEARLLVDEEGFTAETE